MNLQILLLQVKFHYLNQKLILLIQTKKIQQKIMKL